MQNMMIFGNLKHIFLKTFWFQDKRTPETYTDEFVQKKKNR